MRNDGDFMAELTAQALIRAAGALLGTDVTGAEALAGGELSLVLRLDLAAGGAAVVVISQDLDELMEISNRFAALNEGRLSDIRSTVGLTVDEIGLMMGGATAEQEGAYA